MNFPLKKSFLFFFLLFNLMTSAQVTSPFDIKIYKNNDAPKGCRILDYIPMRDGQIIRVNQTKKDRLEFELFDADNKLIRTNESESLIPEKSRYKSSVLLNNRIYLIFSGAIGSDPTKDAFAYWELFPGDLAMKGEMKVFFETTKTSSGLGSAMPVFRLVTSSDKNHVMIVYRFSDLGTPAIADVFDSDWNKKWSYELTTSNFMTIGITNDGKVFAEDGTPATENFYSNGNRSPLVVKVADPGSSFFPKGCTVVEGNGELYIVGVYARTAQHFPRGFYALKLDDRLNPENTFRSDLPENILSDSVFVYDQQNAVYKSLVLKFACVTSDGHIKLAAEQNYEIKYLVTYSNSNSPSENSEKYFGDLVSASISADGTPEWVVQTPKLRKTRASNSLLGNALARNDAAFYCFEFNNTLNFLFDSKCEENDQTKKDDKKKEDDENKCVSFSRIDSKGIQKKYTLAEHSAIGGGLSVKNIASAEPSAFIYNKQDYLVKVKVKNP